MKPYAVFAGKTFYPAEGWEDLLCLCEDIDTARSQAVLAMDGKYDGWWQIVDLRRGEIVESGNSR